MWKILKGLFTLEDISDDQIRIAVWMISLMVIAAGVFIAKTYLENA